MSTTITLAQIEIAVPGFTPMSGRVDIPNGRVGDLEDLKREMHEMIDSLILDITLLGPVGVRHE